MKKRLTALAAVLALVLSLSCPALAAERTTFTDVPAGSWFEEGVMTCAEKGVMVGAGEGRFSPEDTLTNAQCLTMALRLYDLQRGGSGELEKAPEDWGIRPALTLTLADGTELSYTVGAEDRFFYWGAYNRTSPGCLCVDLSVLFDDPADQESWGKAHEGAATLTVNGETYAGTVNCWFPMASWVLSFYPEGGDDSPAGAAIHDALYAPVVDPDAWYRDACYTGYQWGLNDSAAHYNLAELLRATPDNTASRTTFAQALSDAAGELEKKYDVETIPDVGRGGLGENIYRLYEAGILNGKDEYGAFQPYDHLTRAECAVMVARVLDESQRLDAPPAAPNGYERAVADLRSQTGHHNEQRFDAGDCTVFVFDRGGFMNAPTGMMTVIYKAGSALGDGYVLELPHVHNGLSITPADTMDFDPEAGTFTYSYFYGTPAWDSSQSGGAMIGPGTVTFTVDLPTGEVQREYRGVDYAGALAHVTRKRIVSSGEHSEDREVVRTLDTDLCTVVLTRGVFADQYDDYILSLVYKPGSPLGDGTIEQLLLPSTVYDAGYSWYVPTDRAPDSLALSEDGQRLTYVYHFDEPLTNGETVYHEAGTYVYTVDLATGEQSVDLTPLTDLPYRLIDADLGPWEVDGPDGAAAGFLPVVTRDENGAIRDSAIYRADAAVFFEELEGGAAYSGEAPGYCADARYATLLRFDGEGNSQYALFDVEGGTIVVPYQDYQGYLAQAQAFRQPLELFQWDADHAFPAGRDKNGGAVIPCLWDGRYYNENREPITGAFDWVGPVGEDGAGFASRNGNVCRIQF